MALKKQIELENGVTVNYHRIVSINKITNSSIIIEIASYINENKRQEEVNYYNSEEQDKSMNVFIDTTYVNVEYDENKTIQDLYDYLKTTEKFENAEDV